MNLLSYCILAPMKKQIKDDCRADGGWDQRVYNNDCANNTRCNGYKVRSVHQTWAGRGDRNLPWPRPSSSLPKSEGRPSSGDSWVIPGAPLGAELLPDRGLTA